MKKAWESLALSIKTNVASTSIARAMSVWLEHLQSLMTQRAPREELSNCLPLLQMATAYLADSSMESIRFGARSAVMCNTARRAVWMRSWTGDAQSKTKLCALPFSGQRIFGAPLQSLLDRAADRSQGFPVERSTRPPPTSSGSAPRYRGKGKTGRWSYPKGKKGEPAIPLPQRIGGRLLQFSVRWSEVTSNPWTLNLLSYGYRIEFSSRPPSRFMVTPSQSPSVHQALWSGVQDLLALGAIAPVPPEEQGSGFYSPLFLVKKPSGAFRTIINLKRLNDFIVYRRFKMESIRSTIPLISRDAVMATIDLKDAYYHVPIHPSCYRFLRFAISLGNVILHFQFICLPFGISSAPRIFSKVVLEMVSFFRSLQIIVVPYLDDFLLVADSVPSLQSNLRSVIDWLQYLGWVVNLPKSSLDPECSKKFLGVILDSRSQSSSLPLLRQQSVREACWSLYSSPSTSIRAAMRTLGLMTSCISIIPWAQFHCRDLQSFVLRHWDGSQASLSRVLVLSPGVRRSLKWWVTGRNLSSSSLWFPDNIVKIFTDASLTGWGAHIGRQYIQGVWCSKEASHSSNYRELLAVWKALHRFEGTVSGRHVSVFSDNVATVSLIRHQGSTRNPPLQVLAKKILAWAELHLRSLSAFHIRGAENDRADFLSRRFLDPGEWSLHPDIFGEIVALWGTPQVDLFASRCNTKCGLYFSRNACHLSLGVDALSHNWDWDLAYLFPPFPLISRALRKIRESRGDFIFIAPLWSKRPWFPLLSSLALQDPVILPPRPDLLLQGPLQYPDVHRLNLTAWRLRG